MTCMTMPCHPNPAASTQDPGSTPGFAHTDTYHKKLPLPLWNTTSGALECFNRSVAITAPLWSIGATERATCFGTPKRQKKNLHPYRPPLFLKRGIWRHNKRQGHNEQRARRRTNTAAGAEGSKAGGGGGKQERGRKDEHSDRDRDGGIHGRGGREHAGKGKGVGNPYSEYLCAQ